MGAAVVTGAGRGLGLEIARRLAAKGHAVNVTDVDQAAAEAAAEVIGSGAWATALDVRDLFPGLALRMLPLLLADARRKQKRWKKRIEAGKGP